MTPQTFQNFRSEDTLGDAFVISCCAVNSLQRFKEATAARKTCSCR